VSAAAAPSLGGEGMGVRTEVGADGRVARGVDVPVLVDEVNGCHNSSPPPHHHHLVGAFRARHPGIRVVPVTLWDAGVWPVTFRGLQRLQDE